MISIGITGQAGFIGTHLYNFFGLKKDLVERIPFKDEFFRQPDNLDAFVRNCDVIIHLAAVNRHSDPRLIYDTNIQLVEGLIHALERTGSKPHVLFSSSTQEERDNPFGKSKRKGRELLARWAERNGALYTGLIIPNVFGPFGHPYYNSVVATFCHQLTHHEEPRIDVDAELKLIYVGRLAEIIHDHIRYAEGNRAFSVPYSWAKHVSAILEQLKRFRTDYLERGMIPALQDEFERDLFNTFRCYMDIKHHYPVRLTMNTDDRGSFTETVKSQVGGQVSFSTTKPGITRGNHFHTRKIERFAVIRGKARIQLRRTGTDEVISFDLDGSKPSFVDMPVWYTHNITNTGEDELYTVFWINEYYDPNDPDTYFEIV